MKRRQTGLKSDRRIPELDIARGFCVLGMIAIHLLYDLAEIYHVIGTFPPFLLPVKNFGGIAFFVISGISATLGHRPFRRGAQVLICAAAVSIVTRLAGAPVRFGVLHCLGLSMILWTFFRKVSTKALLFLIFPCLFAGAVFEETVVSTPFLYPLGLCRRDFFSADYFPLFPFLGYFLAGTVLGRKLYPARRSLLPRFSFDNLPARFFRSCGVHALPLYLLHQPVLLVFIETAHLLGENIYGT